MKNQYRTLVVGLILVFTLSLSSIDGLAGSPADSSPVVRAVFFYSPSCGHCHKVINEDLPLLIEKYGNQLQIMGINVATAEGAELYQNFLTDWKIEESRYGVPALVVSDIHLIGSAEIPEQFPGIIEDGLQKGGLDWPDLPGFDDILANISQPSETNQGNSEPAETPPETTQERQPGSENNAENISIDSSESVSIPFDQELTVWDRFQMDLAGNILAVVVLVGMVFSLIWVLRSVLRTITNTGKDWSWVIPYLSILGFIVAGYLSFVEVTDTEAVCGPIGNCNSVQQSPYALLFGFLPVGILGLLGYIGITFSWMMKKFGPESWRDKFTLIMWGMTLFGVIFSIYLTYLEPFVIGATCAWCVSSALIITVQFWAATEPVRQLWVDAEDELED